MNRRKSKQRRSAEASRAVRSHGRGAQDVKTSQTPRLSEDCRRRRIAFAVSGLLLLAVVLVFGQTVRHEFINFDDSLYVYDTPQVTGGLSLRGIGWAFTTLRTGNWHPLTWLSLMLDGEVCGPRPWGYHLTNVLLHAAAAILLFQVLWHMTGNLWPAAFVAAVFAIHPLRAESVAWAAERKDVLSGCLFMLTLAAYLGYVRRPFSVMRYSVVLATYALGLMTKPVLVTLPFVLLLLDYWPLGRIAKPRPSNAPRGETGSRGLVDGDTLRRVLCEKFLLLLLAAASCVITFKAQKGAMVPLENVSFTPRIANALVSYAAYLGDFFRPVGLALFYPHLKSRLVLSDWRPIVALLFLAFLSVLAILVRRRRPYLLVGWFWYLGMLTPMIGFVQVGAQGKADRYTYLPQIGLCIAISWGAAAMVGSGRCRRQLCAAVSTAAIAALMICAWRQTALWHNGEILWRHVLACTSRNDLAHNNFGTWLAERGRIREAVPHFAAALDINPRYRDAARNLGRARALIGLKADPADWRDWLRLCPNDGVLLNETAWLLATDADPLIRNGPAAVALAEQAIHLAGHTNPPLLDTLAAAYAEAGRFPEAVSTEQQAITLAAAVGNAEAIEEFRTRLRRYQAGQPYHSPQRRSDR